MYIVVFKVLHRCLNCVVKNGAHVSTLCECHRGDARVTRSSLVGELPIASTVPIKLIRQSRVTVPLISTKCHDRHD